MAEGQESRGVEHLIFSFNILFGKRKALEITNSIYRNMLDDDRIFEIFMLDLKYDLDIIISGK